jgi:membrane fusion protein, multidrug efflux system
MNIGVIAGANKWYLRDIVILERRFHPATTPAISSTKLPHIRGDRLILALVSLWLAGCNNQPPVAHSLPAADVTISKPVQKEVVNWNEFTGRTAAVKLVNITPRVSGYIVDVPFKEGDVVHKGDLLFQIDPRPYQDVYDQASGQLQQAKANQQLQDLTFGRQQHLRETGVIAKEDYDTAFSNKG